MAQQVGDRIISKRADGRYDILEIIEERVRGLVRPDVPTLEDARQVARTTLAKGRQVWYRQDDDDPDHLEPL